MLTVAHRPVPRGSVVVTRRVVSDLGLSITLPGRDVTLLRCQPCLPATRTGHLVGTGVLAVLGGMGAILSRDLPVVDGLGAVVRSVSPTGGGTGTFAGGQLAFARRAVPFTTVEIAGSVVACLGLSVTQLRLTVSHVRREVAIAPFDIALARGSGGVPVRLRGVASVLSAVGGGVHLSCNE